MLRTRVLQTGWLLIGAVVLLVIVGLVGGQQISHQLTALQLARLNYAEYLHLEAETQRLFKQLADSIVTGDSGSDADIEALAGQVRQRIGRLRRNIADEVALHGGGDGEEDEKAELDQLAAIETRLTRIKGEFDRARVMIDSGPSTLRPQDALRQLLDVTIDREFSALLQTAMDIENAEVIEAEQRSQALLRRVQWLAVAAGALAVAIAVAVMVHVSRRLREPLAALLAGTRALARGDLRHRIVRLADDEIGEIGSSFNIMAAELEAKSAEVERGRDALAAEVAERTAELRQANAELRKADGIRRRFFADISHELRTPITVIRGEGEIALRGKPKGAEDYQATLRRIVEQAGGLGQLVDDLLFIARAEATEPRLRQTAVAFDKLVDATCDRLRIVALDRGLRLEATLPAQSLIVLGDQGRLAQLVQILVDNAVRYAQRGGWVGVELAEEGGFAQLRVSDDGIGIPEAELPHVFERFHRAPNAESVNPAGAGLGLPLARAIVQAHAGAIELDSKEGEGTVVTVSLPIQPRLRAIA